MALMKLVRHRAPVDGGTFRTMAQLDRILRVATDHDQEMRLPDVCDETKVPIYVRMVKYKAQKTPVTPDRMIYGPVVRIGSMDSPEIEMFGRHWAAGLTQDYHLDGFEKTDKWLYRPMSCDIDPAGEDVSFYLCDKCQTSLYRDETGRRQNHSACLFNGSLVCRDCEVTGLVYDHDTAEQLARARKLAGFVGDACLANLNSRVAQLNQGFRFGRPSQTRLFREDKFSFNWSCVIFNEDGTRKQGINGGLIQFGPRPIEMDLDRYEFRTWDDTLAAERDATHDEIKGIHWSIHT